MMKRVLLPLAALFSTVPLAAHAQAARRDSLLDHLIGAWVLRGPMAGQNVTHDVTFQWVLGGEYVQMREISRERTAAGLPMYEAIVYLVHDPHTQDYGALWMDNTDYNAFYPAGVGHGRAAGDSIPFVFTDSASRFHNTFVYDRKSDTWAWHMDNEDARGLRPFARVVLTRATPADPRR